jgi:uncharacterized damage-inducible protein DinB
MPRPHSERILKTLAEVRTELIETAQNIPDPELDWAPAEGMKPYRELLQEIGTMEKLTIAWLAEGRELPWDMGAYVSTDSIAAVLRDLEVVRTETKAYLETASEEKMQTPIAVPAEWQQYWGLQLEPEEALRWVTMHEYYHLGQIISYRWIQGHNPYKR